MFPVPSAALAARGAKSTQKGCHGPRRNGCAGGKKPDSTGGRALPAGRSRRRALRLRRARLWLRQLEGLVASAS